MDSKKQGHFHTDAFTRGGQIFSHEWRMKLQNFRNVFLMGLVCAVIGITISALVSGLSWWLLFDFYTMTYLSGKIKVASWSWMQPLLMETDVFLRMLMRGSQGIPSAYKSLSQLTSHLEIPGKGHLHMRTLAFLEHPWVLSQAARVHTVLLWGLGCLGMGIVSMIVGFRRMSHAIEADKILRGKERESLETVARKVKKAGQPEFEIAPGLPLPQGSENQHLAIVGATRMGKTTCILHLLQQVRRKGQRAVILDSTGELTARFYRPHEDILINPLDERSSGWDIWGEDLALHEYDAWASAMIPEGKGDPILLAPEVK